MLIICVRLMHMREASQWIVGACVCSSAMAIPQKWYYFWPKKCNIFWHHCSWMHGRQGSNGPSKNKRKHFYKNVQQTWDSGAKMRSWSRLQLSAWRVWSSLIQNYDCPWLFHKGMWFYSIMNFCEWNCKKELISWLVIYISHVTCQDACMRHHMTTCYR